MQKEKQQKQKHYTCKYFWKPSKSKLDPEEQTQQSNHAGKEVLPKEYCITWVNWLQRAWTFFWDGLCRNEWMSETELAARRYLINWTASNGSWLFYLLTMPGWLPHLFYACFTPPSSLVEAAFLWESLIWARTRFSFKLKALPMWC